MLVAITREVSPTIGNCQLTHLSRQVIDVELARAQHRQYEEALKRLGCQVHTLPAESTLPDSVFVEDTAIVLAEVAVITRPGAATRRLETPAVAALLAGYRPLRSITPPATLDGGDVLQIGRTLHVGRSSRTNQAGIDQLQGLVAPFDYRVLPVEFGGCLHLKSAVTEVGDGLLLANPAWVSSAAFPSFEVLAIDSREPFAANALRIGTTVVHGAQFPRTRERLVARGLEVASSDCSELAKAEGGVTCCSLLLERPAADT
jgi:dimethylargininase